MRFPMKTVLLCACFATNAIAQNPPSAHIGPLAVSQEPAPVASKPLIIHEWGTFTSLQDESGRSIGGVNVDDEALPAFVHRFGGALVGRDNGGKGFIPGNPEVTMRLETPVLYFYPPDDKPITLDVSATFNGGLLTEFYPSAQTTCDGKPLTKPPDQLNANTRGGLEWRNVAVHKLEPPIVSCAPAAAGPIGPPQPPVTDSHVWMTPRLVNSTPVTVAREAEQYLFYRGVGHLVAPLRVMRSERSDVIQIYDNRPMNHPLAPLQLGGMWLADFRADGSCAFREITDAPASPAAKAKAQPATFADADYASENVDKLEAAMKHSLLAAGLFDDEANAMLETWKLSYFKSNGQRLFFLVPRDWTDSVLPLKISQKCDLTRVMMGRIELITPQQRAAAKQLVDQQHPIKSGELRSKLANSLGRFRDAILQDESRKQSAAPAAVGAAN